MALEVVLVEQDKLDELLIPLIFIRAKSKVNFYIRSISILIFFLWPYSTWVPNVPLFRSNSTLILRPISTIFISLGLIP